MKSVIQDAGASGFSRLTDISFQSVVPSAFAVFAKRRLAEAGRADGLRRIQPLTAAVLAGHYSNFDLLQNPLSCLLLRYLAAECCAPLLDLLNMLAFYLSGIVLIRQGQVILNETHPFRYRVL